MQGCFRFKAANMCDILLILLLWSGQRIRLSAPEANSCLWTNLINEKFSSALHNLIRSIFMHSFHVQDCGKILAKSVKVFVMFFIIKLWSFQKMIWSYIFTKRIIFHIFSIKMKIVSFSKASFQIHDHMLALMSRGSWYR